MLMSGQSRKGRKYREIKRVYQIFFLNFILFPDSDMLCRRYFFMEEKEHDRLTDAAEIIFYEMPKLEPKVLDILARKADCEILSGEEKWCTFMKYRHEDWAGKLIEELSRKEEGIMRAEMVAERIDRDYEKFARRLAEEKNRLDIALRREAIRRASLAEGMEQRTLEIARKMKNAGRPLSEIMEFTGLPSETIEQM